MVKQKSEAFGPSIKSKVKRHDDKQAEFVFDFSLEPFSKDLEEKKFGVYAVDAFFFVPPQMAPGGELYTKKDFYDDIRPLFRLKEPKYTFKEFTAEAKKAVMTPLKRVDELLVRLEHIDKPSERDIEGIIFQARLFACCFANFLLRRINRRCRQVSLEAGIDPFVDGCHRLFKRAHHLAQEWDKIVIKAESMSIAEAVVNELKLVAEFCHFRAIDAISRISATNQDIRAVRSEPRLEKIVKIWARLYHYRSKKKGYLWVDSKSPAILQEEYFFRRGDLKKRIWQALYLELEPRNNREIRRQAAYMFVAGIAAAWAFLANFLILYFFRENQISPFGFPQNALNFSSLLAILFFVLAYILKDRIKDIGKERWGITTVDFDYHVWFRNQKDKGVLLGNISEVTKFYKDEEKLPQTVRDKRNSLGKHLVYLQETIVHYRQNLRLNKVVLEPFWGRIWSIRNTFRFNIARYLDYLDGSKEKHVAVDSQGNLCQLNIPKTYHLDVVVSYSFIGSGRKKKVLGFDAARLVMNKNGLLRIEKS